MELALIPPLSRLYDTEKDEWQLMLPHLFSDYQYKAWYTELKGRGQRVILDNGAAEPEGRISNRDLVMLVNSFRPAEFALPDVLGDADATVAQALHFLHTYEEDIPAETAVGFVAQGRDLDEAKAAVDAIIDSTVGALIDVIYIPRLLVKHNGDLVRIDLAEYIANRWEDRLEAHLFGASRYWPQEAAVAGVTDFIRSMDTSLPYVLAHNHQDLIHSLREAGNRPEDYFNVSFDKNQHDLADTNVERLRAWAHGD